jgi:threonine/homoserine/homoserine lactone efflux protein
MPLDTLALAIFVLLMTPGPTNTLLALAGAERGFRGAARLIPAEIAGYLLTTLPLALAGAGLLEAHPWLRPLVTGLAALWVGWLALRLWRLPGPAPRPIDGPADPAPARRSIDAAQVFVTTLLNPKALVFGLVLLPAAADPRQGFALFTLAIVAVACLWAGLGSLLRDGATAALPMLRKAAAVFLAVLSVTLAARVAAA